MAVFSALLLFLFLMLLLLPPLRDLSTHIYERKNKTIPGVVIEEARERKPSTDRHVTL
jgi:hypothetical protein